MAVSIKNKEILKLFDELRSTEVGITRLVGKIAAEMDRIIVIAPTEMAHLQLIIRAHWLGDEEPNLQSSALAVVRGLPFFRDYTDNLSKAYPDPRFQALMRTIKQRLHEIETSLRLLVS